MSDNVTIYVPLDALLDTRIGTLSRMNPDAAKAIADSWYHKRTVDVFDKNRSGINQAEYKKLYDDRDEVTLQHSTMTWLPKYLMALTSRLTTNQGMPLLAEQFKIQINVFPYELSEQVETSIIAAMDAYTNGVAEIEIVSYRPEDLTVNMIKFNYDICYMYNFDEWFMKHTDEFSKVQIPEVRFVVPRLYLQDIPADLIEKVSKEEYGWEQMSLLLMGLVGVVFMDVRLFSFVTETPPNVDV